MQSAYFTPCVPADPELLGLEEEPHAASVIAQAATASANPMADSAIFRPQRQWGVILREM
jgi:hypothetical protein